MRSFADLLETPTPAADNDPARALATATAVKSALKITGSESDALIGELIPRATRLIIAECRLAADQAGRLPTFARETLKATWHADSGCRGLELFMPWRLPVTSVDSVVENGTTLSAGDYILAGHLRRMSGDRPTEWSAGKVEVTFKAGFVDAASIDPALVAACIEQVKGWLFAVDRDPAIRSESSPDIGSVSYSVAGGDTMGAEALLPTVRAMVRGYRNPLP